MRQQHQRRRVELLGHAHDHLPDRLPGARDPVRARVELVDDVDGERPRWQRAVGDEPGELARDEGPGVLLEGPFGLLGAARQRRSVIERPGGGRGGLDSRYDVEQVDGV